MDIQKIQTLDNALVQASKKIRVLNTLAWPAGVEESFLAGWNKGNPKLPEIKLTPPDVSGSIEELDAIVSRCNPDEPIEKFLADTAESYADAGRMISAVGTPAFTNYSTKIYGRPDMVYKYQGMSAIDAAKYFLEITDNLLGNKYVEPTELNISATELAGWLKAEVDEFFEHDTVEVVLDPNISAKALAGATRIRVRGSAVFSQLDKDQLLYHEAFIHTATQLNGKKQVNLKSLGLGAPRTTRTQEGLAVTAELISNSIDLTRLRRIALRVIAVKLALDGADFIDLFTFFLNEGQPAVESVRSAQRIFRGGAVKDGIVFTKDAIYLQGLFEVHIFFQLAIRDNRPDLVKNLFAGRLTMADAITLSPLFKEGWLKPPTYVPGWAIDLRRLGARLAFSAFMNKVKLEKIYLERFIEIEKEIKTGMYLLNS